MKRFLMPLAITVGLAACSAEEPGRIPQVDEPADVTVSTTARAPSVESFPAAVVSERTARVATRMSGTVRQVPVDVGSRVSAGQLLLRLDADDIDARVSAARANVELAERSFRRIESLAADGAASQAELDEVTARLEAARAQLEEARAQQAYAVVRAPFAGEITQRSVDPGDLAVPGRPLLTLVAPGDLEVTAELPAYRAGSLEVGRTLTARVAGVDEPLAAEVTRVVNALGSGSRTFRVEARLLDAPPGVLAGAYARLEIPRAGQGPRWIPSDAVVQRGQLRGVYAVEGDTLRLRWVRLGQRVDGAVELLAAPGDAMTVVRRPAPDLHDGRPVGQVRTEPFQAPPGAGEDGADARAASGGDGTDARASSGVESAAAGDVDEAAGAAARTGAEPAVAPARVVQESFSGVVRSQEEVR
jgi:RND family efflux transporter MFP subunit